MQSMMAELNINNLTFVHTTKHFFVIIYTDDDIVIRARYDN